MSLFLTFGYAREIDSSLRNRSSATEPNNLNFGGETQVNGYERNPRIERSAGGGTANAGRASLCHNPLKQGIGATPCAVCALPAPAAPP